MKYKMFSLAEADSRWERFKKLSFYINKEFKAWSKEHYDVSDRQRFAQKIWKYFHNKCFVIADRVAHLVTNAERSMYFALEEPVHKYSTSFKRNWSTPDYVWENHKEYLKCAGVWAENEMNGTGYLVLHCINERGDCYNLRIDAQNIREIQWAEISAEKFNEMMDLYADDRELRTFKYTERMGFNEMVAKKLCRKNCAANKLPTIMKEGTIEALDYNDAYEKLKEQKIFADTLDLA